MIGQKKIGVKARKIVGSIDIIVGIYVVYLVSRSIVAIPVYWSALAPIIAMGILLIVSGFFIYRSRKKLIE